MKIKSLIRMVEGDEPDQFEVGTVVEDGGLPITDISFYETGAIGGKAYRGACYIIKYGESDLRTVIPAGRVIDILVDVETKKKKEEEAVPPLPTE